MQPSITVRFPERALTELTPHGNGWWPAPKDTAPERDPAFDSIIVIWNPNTIDQITGQPVWIGSAAGLTLNQGTRQTYATMIIDAAINYGHRNVFKHEWGHSILYYFDAVGTAPKPTVTNHTSASQYVHCPSGEYYVWLDETQESPVPNSIYNNQSGFTHDYYSGTTALAGAPTQCLGIPPEAWALGGPVSHSGNMPVMSLSERIQSMQELIHQLIDQGSMDSHQAQVLKVKLRVVKNALKNHRERVAINNLQTFLRHLKRLERKEQLAAVHANMLSDAANTVIDCLTD